MPPNPDASGLRQRLRANAGSVLTFACVFAGAAGAVFLRAGDVDSAGSAAAVAVGLALVALVVRAAARWGGRR